MSKFCSECFNCIIDFFYRIKYQVKKFWKERQRKKEFFSANLFNNEEEQPAKILSSEEIGNMINDQIKFNEEHPNISEYTIVKEIKDEPEKINVNEIKKEIGQVEFDDDSDDETEKLKKKKINDSSDEEEEKDDIEDLKKTILNNPDV
jgi:hypothetical protein